MIRLRRLSAVAAVFLTLTLVTAGTPAWADKQNCSILGGYVQCGFVKSGYSYAVNKFASQTGTVYLCGQARFTNYRYTNRTGFISRVTLPQICANALQRTWYPDLYTKQNTRLVCFNWYITRLGTWTQPTCVAAPF